LAIRIKTKGKVSPPFKVVKGDVIRIFLEYSAGSHFKELFSVGLPCKKATADGLFKSIRRKTSRSVIPGEMENFLWSLLIMQ